MKKAILILSLLLPMVSYAQEGFYSKLSLTVWTRNFEEATASKTNDGVEKTEGGFTPGFGYRFNSNWATELEYLSTMDFTVQENGREGTINMWALTVAPKYYFDSLFLEEKLSFFVKFRVGYTKIVGTSFYGNAGSNSSYTLGPSFGADYQLNTNWNLYLDIGGLWAAGDVEDYDFHPWQIGIRYYF